MSFPRYKQYKDSGVEWLGEVPEHWKLGKLHHIAILNPAKAELGDMDPQTAISFLPMEAFGTKGDPSLSLERTISQVETGYTYFRDGDVAFAKVTPCFENGKRAIFSKLTNGVGFGTTELIILRARPRQTIPKFLYWFVATSEFLGLGEGSMYGAGGLKRVPESFVHQFPVCVPSTDEQNSIVAFLNQETAKIDALIEEQRRLIELLKEKRQAVISHAVTKGINLEVRTENSGSDWLGLIPHHWKSGVLVRCASRIVVGIAEAATHAYADEGVPILRSTNIRAGKIVGDVLRVLPDFAADRDSKLIHSNDLITVRTRNAGVTAVVPPEFDGCQCFTMLITSLADQAVPEFYCYYMNSDIATAYFGVEGWGTAQVNISVPILKALPIPIPPKREQQSIVRYLDAEVGRMDELSSEAEKVVSLLHERRSALISAAVTGKIDTRNYTPRETA